jgi:hypothetical protein
MELSRFITRSDECPHCNSDVHCCLNCTNYDPSAHNRCREPGAEWVSDRERSNFCDFFTPNKLGAGGIKPVAAKDDVKKAFDSLFKK